MARPKKKTTKKRVTKKVVKKKVGESVIVAGILGQPAQQVIMEKTTTAQQVSEQLNFGSIRTVKASKNGKTNFNEIKLSDKVNGYSALLFIPAVSGG